MGIRQDIRNIAIIAHVDHGKTTLVDKLLKQSGVFRVNEVVEERVMDSNDLEKERGITILAKNTSVNYGEHRINIIDTPGHADFGGEVERALNMADGVLLLVDAFEGTMPQTRFVLRKALAMGLKIVVVVNKIDRPEADPVKVVDEVLDLFIELGADEDQLEFPVVYASARDGYALANLGDEPVSMKPIFDAILEHIPAPEGDFDKTPKMLVSNIEYDEYVGKIGIGKVTNGTFTTGQQIQIIDRDSKIYNGRLSKMFFFSGLGKTEVTTATVGDIVAVAGIENISIGETICVPGDNEALPFADIEQPTISMTFCVNDSPFAGREGNYVTSRHLRERLMFELQSNVSLVVEETDTPNAFIVKGRGELHLSVLIETMRRQGYELAVTRPRVLYQNDENGNLLEPIEILVIDVPEEYVGTVIEALGRRKAEMTQMHTPDRGYTRLEFRIPSRGLIGYNSEFLTSTRGHGIMNHLFDGYEPYKGDINSRSHGSMVAWETGDTTDYGLFNAQDRGTLFVGSGQKVYKGMIVGECSKGDDLDINVCKKKHLTNMRASGSDEALRLEPPRIMSLEKCIEFIADDELVEITPKSIRLRKQVLDTEQRAKMRARKVNS
ncbi:MAG: translational GTPase TypA [Clostridia bacterium]|nr:translational GTPase TypA [Clostridia bacterium]